MRHETWKESITYWVNASAPIKKKVRMILHITHELYGAVVDMQKILDEIKQEEKFQGRRKPRRHED